MKEYGNDSINLDVDNNNIFHKRQRPTLNQNNKRKKNFYKNILDENASDNLIELSTQDNFIANKKKSNTTYKKYFDKLDFVFNLSYIFIYNTNNLKNIIIEAKK